MAPLVVNYATDPRMVTNPMTGQTVMMTPGQWVAAPAGSVVPYIWQNMPFWPLLGAEKQKTKWIIPIEDQGKQHFGNWQDSWGVWHNGTSATAPGTVTTTVSAVVAPAALPRPIKWFKEKKPIRTIIHGLFRK